MVDREIVLIYLLYYRYGAVKPPKLKEPPALLVDLLSGDSSVAKKFCLNIRSYNNLLSFASKGISGKLFEQGNVLYCTVLYCPVLYYIVLLL